MHAKNMMYTSDLLGGGSTTTNIPGLHVASIWIMLTTMNWQKISVRTAIINLWKDADTQWAIWHEYSE